MIKFLKLSTLLAMLLLCHFSFATIWSNIQPSYEDLCYSESSTCDPKHKLDIYMPPGTSALTPLIIYIHGGGWSDNSTDGDLSNDKGLTLRNDIAYLYNEGFIIASISYRSTKDGHMFPAQVHDVKTAIRYLRRNALSYNIDPTKIGLAGHSAGGHLAALVGTSNRDCYLEGSDLGHPGYSSSVQAVYTLAPPVDLSIPITKNCNPVACPNALNRFLGCCLNTNECSSDILYDANPVSYINGDEPPFYMVHGSNDCTVSPENSEILNNALQNNNSTLNIIDGASHFPVNVINGDDENEAIYNFFNSNLSPSFTDDQWEIIPNVFVVETKSNLVTSCNATNGRLVLRFENGVQNNITIEGYTVSQALNQFSSFIEYDSDNDLVLKNRPKAEFTIRNVATNEIGTVPIQDGCCINSTVISQKIDLIDCKSNLESKKTRPCHGLGGTVVACMPKSYLNAATIENYPIATLLNHSSGDYYLDIDGDFVMSNRRPATYTFRKGTESGDVEVENGCSLQRESGEYNSEKELLENFSSLNVMPNPASDLITLEIAKEISKIYSIEILDLNGRVIQQIANGGDNGNRHTTDISELKTGIHVVRVFHELGIETVKFIKY